MEKKEKEFILNKGLMLGLVLLIFPIIDLTFGLNMSLTNYLIVFFLAWTVVYTYFVVKWSKEFASYYELFSFRDAFRILFVISAIGFGVLTVGKSLLWTFSYPDKYVEINEKRELSFFSMQKSVIDNAYTQGAFSEDEYEDQLELYSSGKQLLTDKWDVIRKEGLGTTYFLQILITVLFFIAIYCAILALFVRKKETFIKTN
ncbi:MAG: DUF4199 family protein [Flavobacteriales bacterium]|nr:DUF4199 family protein [Flavobacteriales bacterium]